MCIECWWDCLTQIQQGGLKIMGVVLVTAPVFTLICWLDDIGFWDKKIFAILRVILWWLFILPLGVLGFIIVCLIIYGLYGAIACLF